MIILCVNLVNKVYIIVYWVSLAIITTATCTSSTLQVGLKLRRKFEDLAMKTPKINIPGVPYAQKCTPCRAYTPNSKTLTEALGHSVGRSWCGVINSPVFRRPLSPSLSNRPVGHFRSDAALVPNYFGQGCSLIETCMRVFDRYQYR